MDFSSLPTTHTASPSTTRRMPVPTNLCLVLVRRKVDKSRLALRCAPSGRNPFTTFHTHSVPPTSGTFRLALIGPLCRAHGHRFAGHLVTGLPVASFACKANIHSFRS